ncbi:MAG: hypothetical protein NVSMB52_09720 [Chloroflexota bacterium]
MTSPDREKNERPRIGTERILAFSDGVFAIAITLLVLNVTWPQVQHGLLDALLKGWPAYVSYVMSFIVIVEREATE